MGSSHVILKEKNIKKREFNFIWNLYLETKRSIQTLTLLILHPKQIIFKLRRYHLVKNKTCVSLKHVLLFDFINPSNLAAEHGHRHDIRTKHTKKQMTLKYYYFLFSTSTF